MIFHHFYFRHFLFFLSSWEKPPIFQLVAIVPKLEVLKRFLSVSSFRNFTLDRGISDYYDLGHAVL